MNHQRSSIGPEALAGELESLGSLSTRVLKDRWRQLFGAEPGKGLRRGLLIGGIAYRLQEHAFGGLRPNTRRWLEQLADSLATGGTPPQLADRIAPGTRLLRDWQGATYEALVVEGSILFQGKRHRSLSEVARLITGSRWSGPRFFGLKAKKPRNVT